MSETVFRVQDAEGRGPYRPGMSAKWVDRIADERLRPPSFIEFGMSIINKKKNGESMGCGFRTMGQLLKWFSISEIVRMKDIGYDIVEMDVDQIVAESNRQLVFVRKLPLNESIRKVAPSPALSSWPR